MDDLEEMAKRMLLISHGRIAFDGSFHELRKVAGCLCRVVLTMQGENIPHLACAKLRSANQGICEYEVGTKISFQTVLSEIATIPDVIDIEIKKAPLEQMIVEMYNQWRGERVKTDQLGVGVEM